MHEYSMKTELQNPQFHSINGQSFLNESPLVYMFDLLIGDGVLDFAGAGLLFFLFFLLSLDFVVLSTSSLSDFSSFLTSGDTVFEEDFLELASCFSGFSDCFSSGFGFSGSGLTTGGTFLIDGVSAVAIR